MNKEMRKIDRALRKSRKDDSVVVEYAQQPSTEEFQEFAPETMVFNTSNYSRKDLVKLAERVAGSKNPEDAKLRNMIISGHARPEDITRREGLFIRKFNKQLNKNLRHTAKMQEIGNAKNGDVTALGRYQNYGKEDVARVLAPLVVGVPSAGTGVLGTLVGGVKSVYANPLLRFGLDMYGTADGIKNLFTDEGVTKTIRAYQEGDFGGGTKSLAGDLFDAVSIIDSPKALKGAIDVAKTQPKITKAVYSAQDRYHGLKDLVNMERFRGVYPIMENGQIVGKKPKVGDTHAIQMRDTRSNLIYHNNGASRLDPNSPKNISFSAIFPNQQGYASVYPEEYINNITLTPAAGEVTIPKDVMRNFWKGVRDVVRPGTYISGDVSTLPLGEQLHRAFTNGGMKAAVKKLLEKRTVKPHFGLSPDSYRSIIAQAGREGYELRGGSPFSGKNGNQTGVDNAGIYPIRGESSQSYLTRFNKWADEIGGRHAYIDERGIVQIPHPYIFVKQNPSRTPVPKAEYVPPVGNFGQKSVKLPDELYVGQGGEQMVYELGKDQVQKVFKEYLPDYKSAAKWAYKDAQHRNLIPGQLPVKTESVLKAEDGKFYPRHSQQKVVETFENGTDVFPEFKNQMETNYGYRFEGDQMFTDINGRPAKLIDVSPYNIGRDSNGKFHLLDVGFQYLKQGGQLPTYLKVFKYNPHR